MSKVPVPVQHRYEEYTFDTTVNQSAWNSLDKGLHVTFATTDQLFFRSEVPVLDKISAQWNAAGWKGERLNVQVLVWSSDTQNSCVLWQVIW